MPAQNPVVRLFSSSKALVMLLVIVASFAALFLGKATWDQITDLIKWTIGPWLLAQGAEDVAAKWGSGSVVPGNVPPKS